MKKGILLSVIIFCFQHFSHAQCDKAINWISSKTEFLDANKNVQDSKVDNVVFEVTKNSVKLIPNQNEDDAMSGTIKEVTCNWQEPFKNGTTVIKTNLSDTHNGVMDATITIAAKDGKITILFEAKEMPDRKLRLTVDKYEEKEG